MSEKQPLYALSDNTSRTLGREAQRNNILAAKVVADIVKTTLGPKGMDKMLVDSNGEVIITNDGVTILEEMEIDHPAAKMIADIARTQESEVGDGTTTAALLAGKLLEHAEQLLDRKIHPTIIVKGYELAGTEALRLLEEFALPVRDREILKQIAMTAMTGKGAEGNKERLAELIVQAVEQVAQGKDVVVEDIKIQKVKGEHVQHSELVQGIVLDSEKAHSLMPSHLEDASILILDCSLEIKSPEQEAKISVSSPEQLHQFIASDERYLKEISDALITSGAKAIFCQKGIDDVVQYYLAKAGVFACRRVPKSDLERLARATSANIVSHLHDLNPSQFGYAAKITEVRSSDGLLTYIQGCKNPRAVTIVVRGSTQHVLDEIERAMKDGLGDVIAALKSGKIVPGGGAIEMALSKRLRTFARTLGGREQLAVDAFANALESIPEALAENAGLDPIEILSELKRRHESGSGRDGLNLFSNQITDTFAAGIIEPLKVKTQAIASASEVARMILRIDDVLISKSSATKKQMKESQYDAID